MSGFIRRFTEYPPDDVITAIEGINIVDLPPPGSIQGVSTNVVCLVGEFPDMTYALQVSSTGVFSAKHRPQEIVSGQDLLNKVGGFDVTLGDFGSSMGNGYVELRNKSFGRLIVCPVNLASPSGVRLWRQLPTNAGATNPSPVVPLQAAQIAAGTIFKETADAVERLKIAARITFSGDVEYTSGIDGSVTNAVAAATNTFTSAAGGFTTIERPDGKVGVEVGDILVTGVVGLAGAQGDDAGTWRVTAVTSDTVIRVQRLDTVNFAWTTTSAILAWRLHPGRTADSYGSGTASGSGSQGSYTVPVRPLTNSAGSSAADGSWPIDTQISPLVAAAAITATTWEPLTGLAGKVGPTTAVAYDASVQKANAVSDATIDVLYTAAFDALLADEVPTSEIAHVWPARKSDTIRLKCKTHVLDASSNGVGRTASISPKLNMTETTVLTDVTATAAPGVGATRDERVFYHWPPVKTYIPEAVGEFITQADGSITTDGVVDVTADGWMSAIMGNLAPERNPGESSGTTKKVLAPVLGYARAVPAMTLNSWKLLRARGISGIRMDKTVGPVFQSGITSSLETGRKNIARRKMTDYIEDSIAQSIKPFAKLPMSESFKDGVLGQIDDFMVSLLSPDNPAAQRIAGYIVDGKSGNTPESEAKGIYVVIVRVRTLASADFIVVQVESGEGVIVTTEAA